MILCIQRKKAINIQYLLIEHLYNVTSSGPKSVLKFSGKLIYFPQLITDVY